MKADVVHVRTLQSAQRDQMFVVLVQCFEGVTASQFQRDLDEKDYVVLLRDDTGTLVGFSTYMMYQSAAVARCTVVCSGDTVVLPCAWGSFALHRIWLNTVRQQHLGFRGRLFWLLITSGFRTYRFLPVFFRRFVPSCMAESTAPLRGRLAAC